VGFPCCVPRCVHVLFRLLGEICTSKAGYLLLLQLRYCDRLRNTIRLLNFFVVCMFLVCFLFVSPVPPRHSVSLGVWAGAALTRRNLHKA